MPELTPLDDNRQEHFLNGEDLEPITRREHFYAGRESELPAGHQEPETREEWFIQKYRGGGGDVTVVPLSVTDNGTYSEEGKAYSPVSVNVPLPQNAYLLKSVANLPQAIASFNDGEDMVMPSLKVAIEPQQDLHGYDAPWVGGAGKNKAKPYSYTVTAPNGVTFTYNGDGSVTLNGTATASQAVPSVSVAVQNDLTFTLGSGTWIPSVSANNVTYEVYDTATSTLLSNGASFTLTEAKTVLFRVGAVNGQTYNNLKVYMQIESGSTATSYAPYSNICSISGWDKVNVNVSGKNLCNPEECASVQTSADVTYRNGYVISKVGTYTIKSYNNSGSNIYIYYKIIENGEYGTSQIIQQGAVPGPSKTITITEGQSVVIYDAIDELLNKSKALFENVQIEVGTTATSYEPYAGNTYEIDLDGTRYGGEVDVVNGTVTPAPYYASYNGETLTGEWISDRDKYEVGATPTIGAQVVNIGASGTPVSILPTAVKSLRGVNNVWADTGDIMDAEYFSKEV